MSFTIVKTLFSPFEYEELRIKRELCSMMNPMKELERLCNDLWEIHFPPPPTSPPTHTHIVLVQRQEGWCTWVLPLASPGPSRASLFDVTVVGLHKRPPVERELAECWEALAYTD